MSGVYTHRNGEYEIPTIEGWYWFHGLDDGKNAEGLVKVNLSDTAFPTLTVSPQWIDGWTKADVFNGQWWGPVTIS